MNFLSHDVADGKDVASDVAPDRGSLAEAVAAIVVLGIASSMVVTFAFTSMKSERRLRLKAESLNLINTYSAGRAGSTVSSISQICRMLAAAGRLQLGLL